MSTIKQLLTNTGLILPQAPTPVGAYRATMTSGKLLYVSGQFPFRTGSLEYKGQLGKDMTTEEGYQAAELCALNLLSQINKNHYDKKIIQLIKLDGFINCCASFEEHAQVLDGATNLISNVLGEHAGHTRTVSGCNSLPHGAAVEISAIIELA